MLTLPIFTRLKVPVFATNGEKVKKWPVPVAVMVQFAPLVMPEQLLVLTSVGAAPPLEKIFR
jgi:hypothetical protein